MIDGRELVVPENGRDTSYYRIFCFSSPEAGREFMLKQFPDASYIDEMNLVFFSTSGVHGSYLTIEDIEERLRRRPHGVDQITAVLFQPRIVSVTYGDILVRSEDIPWLKSLREKTWESSQVIGRLQPTRERG